MSSVSDGILLSNATQYSFLPHVHRQTTSSSLLTPSPRHHARLDRAPNHLHNLTISPSLPPRLSLPVLINRNRQHTSSPALDSVGQQLALPADIDTQCVREQIRWGLPFVPLELPRLASCEDAYDTVPVVWSEIVGRLD